MSTIAKTLYVKTLNVENVLLKKGVANLEQGSTILQFPLHLKRSSNLDSQRSQKLTNKLSWVFTAYTCNQLYFSSK